MSFQMTLDLTLSAIGSPELVAGQEHSGLQDGPTISPCGQAPMSEAGGFTGSRPSRLGKRERVVPGNATTGQAISHARSGEIPGSDKSDRGWVRSSIIPKFRIF